MNSLCWNKSTSLSKRSIVTLVQVSKEYNQKAYSSLLEYINTSITYCVAHDLSFLKQQFVN
jgi:hypothetical protein